jgi:hypothetical protein
VKRRYPIILLLAAIAIAVAVIVIENPMRSRVDDVADGTFSPGFDSNEVELVQITQLLSGAELKRDGERWLVSESVTPIKDELLTKEGRERPGQRWFRADRGRVVSALGSFGGLPEGVVVSTNSEKRALYQVEATGLRVRLIGKGGEVIEDVIVGKNGPDLASNYVRRPDEDEVYLVRHPLIGVFSPNAPDWRERKLWMLRPADIAALSVSSKDGSFEARRGGDDFEGIASALSHVSADGFPRDPDMQPGEEIATLRVEYDGGDPLTLRIYEEEDDGRYSARLEGVDETYLLTKEFVESLPKGQK